jgi:putative ABC transport system substrate-binding protein
MRRREFITLLGGAAAVWPLAARAQQPALPVIGYVAARSFDDVAAFRKGLSESGYFEGQNVTVEYYWLAGKYEQFAEVISDLIRRRVTVIATPGTLGALAAKAATTSIPIVFGVGDDPVRLGLVASLARPGGNATGINYFIREVTAKRLRLLHELVPKAVRIAVHPDNPSSAESTIREVSDAARSIGGLQIRALNAHSSGEIESVFEGFTRDPADALFLAPDGYFVSRRLQFATLAARDRLPTSCSGRAMVNVGGLMSYATDGDETDHQVGLYAGRILKGAKPADLPVLQATKFKFVINLITARALGLAVSPDLLSIADEVIE